MKTIVVENEGRNEPRRIVRKLFGWFRFQGDFAMNLVVFFYNSLGSYKSKYLFGGLKLYATPKYAHGNSILAVLAVDCTNVNVVGYYRQEM